MGSAKARSYLNDRANQIRSHVRLLLANGFQLEEGIDLRSDRIRADYYEESTIAYKLHEKGHLPPDGEIIADIDSLLKAY